jgi:hypothetical protein
MPDASPSDGSHSIRAGYDRWGLVYDHDANPLPALEEPFVREAVRYPRAEKYVGWPMLVVLRMRA